MPDKDENPQGFNAEPERVSLVGAPYAGMRYGAWPTVVMGAMLVALCLDFTLHIRFVPFTAIGLLAYVCALPLVRLGQWRRLEKYGNRVGSARLLCYGNVDDLAAVAALEERRQEPYVVRCSEVTNATVWMVCLLFAAIWFVCLAWLPHQKELFVVMALTAPGAWLAERYLLPTYYRVVDRQIEVLRPMRLAWPARRGARVSLEGARVECRFEKRSLVVVPAAPDGRKTVLSLSGMKDVHEFVRRVFAAAITAGSELRSGGDASGG